MKFFCEYCGCRIDAERDTKCPNCGASYKKNETFIRLEKEKQERENRINEFQDNIYGQAESISKIPKLFLILPIAFFAIIAIIIIGSFVFERSDETTNNLLEVTKDEIKPVTVTGLNTYGEYDKDSTLRYKAKVTQYETVDSVFYKPKEGYEYVKFYLVVENLSTNSITRPEVNCIVDGIAQTNESSSGYSTIPFFIEEGLTVKGEAIFEVPKDATSYDIRFGSKLTIHIDKK